MDVIISQTLTGSSIAAVLLLVALGLSLTFGQMGVINMAHGEFLMAGAYTAYVTGLVVGQAELAIALALPLAFAVAGLLGVFLEWGVIRHMYHRPLDTLLVTVGVAIILQQAARQIFGAQGVPVPRPDMLQGQLDILGYDFAYTRIFILVVAIAGVTGMALVLRRTDLGRQIRATVQNRDLAETSGVSTQRTDRMTFFLGSGLAGMAGVALTQVTATVSTLGTAYIIPAFLVVVSGGLGQIKGTVVMAITLGILTSFLTYLTGGSTAQAVLFLIVVIFLQVRPRGLFTVRRRSLA